MRKLYKLQPRRYLVLLPVAVRRNRLLMQCLSLLGTQVGHTMGRLSQTQHWPKPAQMEINKCSSIIVGRGEEEEKTAQDGD